jgi:hypothetical protein
LGYTGILQLSITELGLSQRAINGLLQGGISVVRQLVICDDLELRRKCFQLDPTRVAEISGQLSLKGLRLGMQLTLRQGANDDE